MSPAGGVGINLAIQDAVATANLLAEKLRIGPVHLNDLRTVQARREWPTRQSNGCKSLFIIELSPAGSPAANTSLPFVLRFLKWFPILRQVPARFIGLGPRPEHVRSPTVV